MISIITLYSENNYKVERGLKCLSQAKFLGGFIIVSLLGLISSLLCNATLWSSVIAHRHIDLIGPTGTQQ